MDLSISNIGWEALHDQEVYALMKECGFTGLEIAPTRIFPEDPYSRAAEAAEWSGKLRAEHGFTVPSMQSIWYRRPERIFESAEERAFLTDYTKKAIDFAAAIGCGNLVFGCPRNRSFQDGEDVSAAVPFFRELGEYAASKGTMIGLEANPPMYQTNFINDTRSALDLIEAVDSDGFRLNLDLGTMIALREDLTVLEGHVDLISHVHVSEPGLQPLQERSIHTDLAEWLRKEGYRKFVSIEVGKQENVSDLADMMRYVRKVFGDPG